MITSAQLLPDKSKSLLAQQELNLLAMVIWGEARGEPQKGMSAVAHVVKNRWHANDWFGKTIRDVILKPYQFSCFNSGDANRQKVMNVQDDDVWKRCSKAALDAYFGKSPDPTGGATHYCRWDSNPKWKKDMKKVCQIGNHEFYK